MPPMNLPWLLAGRPVKPVALAMLISMISTSVTSFTGTVIGFTGWTRAVGVFAAVVAVLFIVGFITGKQRLAQAGLLGAFAVWAFRIVLYLIETHPSWDRVVAGVIMALIAGGSYLLEVADPAAQRSLDDARRNFASGD